MGWHKIPEFETVSSFDDNPLPVYMSSQPVKCHSNSRWMTGYAGKWTNLTSPSQKGILQETLTLLASSKISLSSLPDLPDGMGCMWRRRTVRVTQYAPGHQNWPNSTIPSVRLHVEVFLLPHPPGPSVRTCSGVGRERHMSKLCNQAVGLSRCLTRVQDAMSAQLKTLHLDKGKSSERTKQAFDELDYLVTFNRSVSQAMAQTMQDLSEGVFISMANFTLGAQGQLFGVFTCWCEARHSEHLENVSSPS